MDTDLILSPCLVDLRVTEIHRTTTAHGSPRAALRYAAHAYAALDRRMDEADALTKWVARFARALGLTEEQAPNDERLDKPARLGVTVEAWQEVGRSLASAGRHAADDEATEAERWVTTVADALALDPLEADILALAVQYGLDRRTERLFDALSGARQGPSCLHLDAHLFALLLEAPVHRKRCSAAPNLLA